MRYADDLVIFVKTRKAANRVKESVSNFIERELNLKVNRDKTQAVYMTKVKFLGFSFYVKRQILANCRLSSKIDPFGDIFTFNFDPLKADVQLY